jgi:hypothetical protein
MVQLPTPLATAHQRCCLRRQQSHLDRSLHQRGCLWNRTETSRLMEPRKNSNLKGFRVRSVNRLSWLPFPHYRRYQTDGHPGSASLPGHDRVECNATFDQ